MTSQDALRALTPEQAARLGELDEIADDAAAVADLAQLEHDALVAECHDVTWKMRKARDALEAAQTRADEARSAAVQFRGQAGVVRTASGYLTRDEAARLYHPSSSDSVPQP